MTAVNLNAATITDGAGNAANLSWRGDHPDRPADRHHDADDHRRLHGFARERRPRRRQDRHADARHERGGDGHGGTPTLTLNDGGTATYISGSGTNALTFSYTVGAGQNTADLAVTAVNLNAATITDGAGNAANLSLAGLTQTGPQIDTTTPTISVDWRSHPRAATSTPARP